MRLFFYTAIILFFTNVNLIADKKTEEIKILKNLRCLVCQGQSILESNSDFAQTIKLVVRDQINNGKTEKEIYNFMVSKYGEWILYKPLVSVPNLLLWLIPYLILLFGGLIIFIMIKKREDT